MTFVGEYLMCTFLGSIPITAENAVFGVLYSQMKL
jgi:hypothetical protein